ncbi:MAG: DUF853 domain-containing protein, partial [Actinomycetota bacterium]|nr:DUF853 domain-containing protein [Actinomycetota bacterium]
KGAPTPVAHTRLRAPESVMGPSTEELVRSTVGGSALLAKYGTAVDNVSAYEKLTGKAAAPTGGAAPGEPPVPGTSGQSGSGQPGSGQADVDAEARRIEEEILGRPSSRPAPAPDRGAGSDAPSRRAPEPAAPAGGGMVGDLAGALGGALGGGLKSMVRSLGTQLGRELLRGVFGTSSRRRR